MSGAWSTYRVQLHRDFTFADLADITDYLSDLGITHAYCSPALQAVAGSTHGYDVVDPHRINPELGGISSLGVAASRLHGAGIGLVLDIVPNHMALNGPDNRWWWDVLANGPSSAYASYFDIDWDSPERKLTGSVLVPVLGDHYGRVLEAGQLQVERVGGAFVVRYGDDHLLPLSPRSVDGLLATAAARVPSDELSSMATALGSLPHALVVEPKLSRERARGSRIVEERLRRLIENRPEVGDAIEAELKVLNDDSDALDDLLQRQNFRLAFWRTASEELDYRRFFNIETLVGLRVEDEEVFADTHGLIVALIEGGVIEGLRIDHVDGLRDPHGYLERLRDATGGASVVVEKILAPDEVLPAEWPVAGTTGYEFLNRVNGLFVAATNISDLSAVYSDFTGVESSFATIVRHSKMQIMQEELATEIERLTALWALVCERHRRHRDYTRRELREGLREVLATFPVYRTYVRPGSAVSVEDRRIISAVVATSQDRRPDLDPQLFTFLGQLLQLEYRGDLEEELAARFQQLSGPVMAKGVEDTAFYRYHRLISLNEVGGSPDVVEGAVTRFHQWNRLVASHWPRSLLTLATHDTKRGPDTRSRINVLSEIPAPWATAVSRWAAHNDRYLSAAGFPDRNAEYLLYQTLVGAWPVSASRLAAYMEKATKEAKTHTSWTTTDGAYDTAMQEFVAGILADPWFVSDVESFLASFGVVKAGRTNSLSQAALLLTSPGSVDLYQGTKLWDHSLVDPDNRRPVDYALRRRLLDSVSTATVPPPVGDDGAAKLFLTHRLLADRRDRPSAYDARSLYEPLFSTGPDADHVVAFRRTGGLVTVVPRLPLGFDVPDATLGLPVGTWTDLLSGATWSGSVAVGELWSRFPVAVLAGAPS